MHIIEFLMLHYTFTIILHYDYLFLSISKLVLRRYILDKKINHSKFES